MVTPAKEAVRGVGGVAGLEVVTQHPARPVENPDLAGILHRPTDHRVSSVENVRFHCGDSVLISLVFVNGEMILDFLLDNR